MKKLLASSLLLVLFGLSTAYSQFSFGVSPGFDLNSAYFGYKIDKLVPYISLEYLSASETYTHSGQRWNSSLNKLENYSDKYEAAASVFIPTIGAKYFITEIGKIKPFLNLNLSKPIISASNKDNGLEDSTFKNALDNLSIFGMSIGFGVEYNFDEHFSLGGEFSIRYIYASYSESYTNPVYTPASQVNGSFKDEFSFNLMPTITKIHFNYYF